MMADWGAPDNAPEFCRPTGNRLGRHQMAAGLSRMARMARMGRLSAPAPPAHRGDTNWQKRAPEAPGRVCSNSGFRGQRPPKALVCRLLSGRVESRIEALDSLTAHQRDSVRSRHLPWEGNRADLTTE